MYAIRSYYETGQEQAHVMISLAGQQLSGMEQGCTRDDRRGEEKGEACRRLTPDAPEESRGYGNARAGDARDDGNRLCDPDGQCISKGDLFKCPVPVQLLGKKHDAAEHDSYNFV